MKKRIVLIFLGDFFYDGRCINMANSIINNGYELYVIDTGKSKNAYKGIIFFHIKIKKNGFFRYVDYYLKTKKIINKIKPQTIIASDLYSLPSAFSLKNTDVIYDSREIYSQHAGMINNRIKQYFWHMVENKFIKNTKAVLVTADGDELILNKLYDNLNIIKIYNFPSCKMKSNKNNLLRKKINLSENKKIFLYQGVLHAGRGIKSMISLLNYFSEVHAVIIGDGPNKKNIINFVKKNNLIHKVHFLGKIKYEELLQFTSGADIGFSIIRPISKSYEQALPNKIFEYALSEVPIICSDLIEMKKIVQKYQIGIAVPFNDIEKQIMGVKKILRNKKYFITKSKNSDFIWESQEIFFMKVIN